MKKFEVGDYVRVKLAKGKLSKMSDQSWSSTIYQVGKVIPARGTISTKYKIEGRDQDQSYSRNDLLKVNPETVEKIPERPIREREVIQNGRPVEIPVTTRQRTRRTTRKKITEMPDWRKGKMIFAKFPVEGTENNKRVTYEWYTAKVVKREDLSLLVQFTLDKVKRLYTLDEYRNGFLSETMPEDAPAVNSTPSQTQMLPN